MVEVELVQRFAGREAGGADASFAAVGFPGGDFALQAGGEELLVGPGFGSGPLGQPLHRRGQRRAFNARVRNAISTATLRVLVLVAIRRPSSKPNIRS